MNRPTLRQLTVLGLLLLLPALVGCKKLKARDELNKGVRAFKGGDIVKAVEHFKVSIENDPELLNAQLYLATAYASEFVPGATSDKNRQIAEIAIKEFTKVLDTDPKHSTALTHIASIYFGLQDFEKAKEYRRKLIEIDPKNPEHYYSIGVTNWTLTFAERMKLRTRLGIQATPDEPLPRRAISGLADTNAELVEEGVEALEKALEINPLYLDAITYLNLMYREKADIVPLEEREQYLVLADEWFEKRKQAEAELKREAGQAPAS